MGWNSKFDEWILKEGQYVAALGASKYIIQENKKAVLNLLPWYESEKLLERARAKFGDIPERKQCYARIEGIEDW